MIKRPFLFLIGAGLLFLHASCEGYRCAEGVIKDSQTKKLLDSVTVKVISGNEVQSTDSTGTYSVCNKFTSCVPDCPDIIVQFSRKGYTTLTLTNPTEKVIYLGK